MIDHASRDVVWVECLDSQLLVRGLALVCGHPLRVNLEDHNNISPHPSGHGKSGLVLKWHCGLGSSMGSQDAHNANPPPCLIS
eukprot:1394259-Amorphochlora_amoeboformis.AAC.1